MAFMNSMRKPSYYAKTEGSNYNTGTNSSLSEKMKAIPQRQFYFPDQIAEESSPNRSLMSLSSHKHEKYPSQSRKKGSNPSLEVQSTKISALVTDPKSSEKKTHDFMGRNTMPVHCKENDGLYTLKFGNQSLGNFGQLRASNGDLEISPLQDTPGLNKSMVTNYPTYSLYENSRNDRIAFRQSRANSDLRMNDSTNIVNNSRCDMVSTDSFKNRTHSVNFHHKSKKSQVENTAPSMNTLTAASGHKYLDQSIYSKTMEKKNHKKLRDCPMKSFSKPKFIKSNKSKQRKRNKTSIAPETYNCQERVRNLSASNYANQSFGQNTYDNVHCKKKKATKASKYLSKNVTVPWKSTLRSESVMETKWRQIKQDYAVKRMKFTDATMKDFLMRLYQVFTSENTESYISYEVFVAKLEHLKII